MIDQGIVKERLKDQNLKLGFWDAPISCLNGLEYGKRQCELCNTEQIIFTFNPDYESQVKLICLECLKKNNGNFFHSTELGYVFNTPIDDSLKDSNAHDKVSESSFREMQLTTHYVTLQGEEWKCHCDDFMMYKGTWEAPDFTENSVNGNGKELFLSMTDEINNLWDDFELNDNETESTWSDVLYHVFECRHCKIKLGYWEC
jgi:hypothetical protein